jgi:N-acetylmuramoyl-L-alanine amidase
MLKVVIDAGHGYETTGKRSPDGMREYEFNRAVANAMRDELENYENVAVYFTHSDKRDVPLKERTDYANKICADVFVSIHANAYRGVWGDHTGIETYVYTSRPKEATKLAEVVQRNLVAATGLKDRGVKTANFHVLRETKMTAILIEHGYMDSRIDCPKLKDDAFRKLCGVTNARSLAEFYGLKRKAKLNPNVLYKVQIGAFSSRENAEKLAKEAQAKGFKTYIVKEDTK